MVDPFQPVFQGRGMYYPVCGMVYIKEPLLLVRKNSPCNGDSRFPLLLGDPLPYVRHHITINKKC